MDIQEFLILKTAGLRTALEVIDRTAQGVCFVVNEGGVLEGVLTDGDIRRALLKGATLESLAANSLRKKFISLPVTADNQEIQAALSEQVRVIPLLDEQGRPVDVASFSGFRKIQVLEPSLNGNELAYVTDCIRTNWISSQGAYVRKFEQMFGDYIGVKDALAVSNGTVALHLALVALGIGEGDEVIVPNLTFAASANAVIHAGAIPVFVDVDAETWTMDVESTRKAITSKTKAIMPVHLYGHACRMKELMALCKESGIFMIEDCAESIGTTYEGKHTGSFGDVACFSFFGNKTITTGEGGMILFKSNEVYQRASRLRDHGMSKERRYWHDEVGYNYRLTNLQAAVGVAQMERVGQFVEAKRKLADAYNRFFKEVPGISVPPNLSWNQNSYWLYTVRVEKECPLTRDELHDKLLLNGIETRRVFFPLDGMPPYRKFLKPGQKFPVSDLLAQEGLCLPSSVALKSTDIQTVTSAIQSLLGTRSAWKN